MKFALTIVLLAGFAGVVILGVMTMSHESGDSHNDCIAAAVQGVDCKKVSDSLPFVAFHFNAFKIFSTAVFSGNTLNIFTLLVSLMLLIGFVISSKVNVKLPQLNIFPGRKQFLESFFLPQKEFTRWLAFHENSPAVA